MSIVSPELNQAVIDLHLCYQAGGLDEARLVRAAPFRQLAEVYVYGTFWRRHRDFIRDKSRNLDAEDLLAVAMIGLLDGFKVYEPERRRKGERPQTLLSYLTLKMYQACHKEVRDNYARESWKRSAPSRVQIVSVDEENAVLEGKLAERSTPLLDPANEFERTLIRDAVERLPRLYARIVYLHHFEGRTFEQIGALLWPARPENRGTVKRHYNRALGYLRPELEAMGVNT